MKLHIFLLVLLQYLGCSGLPLYNSELASTADRALGAALAQVNSVYAVGHLYRATRGSVSRVSRLSFDTVELLMTFGIKETECVRASTKDPQTCAFRPGFFVPTFPCSSQVRISTTSSQVVSLRCGHDESSSSESSEEMFSMGRRQFNIPSANRGFFTGLAPPAPPPPVQPGRSPSSQKVGIQLRGDTFTNYLE